MSKKKNYAVMLADNARVELGSAFNLFIKNGVFGDYIYAVEIDPNSAFFMMKVENEVPYQDDPLEFEVQIPHRHIRGIFVAADLRKLGFT